MTRLGIMSPVRFPSPIYLLYYMINLANNIMNYPLWNWNTTQVTQPTLESKLSPIVQPTSIPFGPALPVDVALDMPRHR